MREEGVRVPHAHRRDRRHVSNVPTPQKFRVAEAQMRRCLVTIEQRVTVSR
jgi:hypothetical protein